MGRHSARVVLLQPWPMYPIALLHTTCHSTVPLCSYEEAGEAVEAAQAVLMQKIRERYTQVGTLT